MAEERWRLGQEGVQNRLGCSREEVGPDGRVGLVVVGKPHVG